MLGITSTSLTPGNRDIRDINFGTVLLHPPRHFNIVSGKQNCQLLIKISKNDVVEGKFV